MGKSATTKNRAIFKEEQHFNNERDHERKKI